MSTDGGVGAIHFGDYCISPWRKDKDAGYHFVVVVIVVVIVVVVVVVLFW
jgi:t-SNARE complex subunit (syntaxin)